MHRIGFRIAIFTSAIACSACLTPSGRLDITATDRDVLNPGARISWQAFPRDESRRQGLLGAMRPTGAAEDTGGSLAPAETVPGSSEAPTQHADPEAATSTGDSSPAGPSRGVPAPDPSGADERVPFEAVASLDLEYRVGLAGEDRRGVADTRFVDYDGTRFLGPQTLEYDYSLHAGTISGRGGLRVYEILALEGLVGLTTSALQLEARGTTDRASDTGVGLGAHVGARATLTPHPVFDLYGQLLYHLLGGLQSDRNEVVMQTIDLAGDLHLASHLSFFGGWRWWTYEEQISHDSDVEVELSGPAFGVLLRF